MYVCTDVAQHHYQLWHYPAVVGSIVLLLQESIVCIHGQVGHGDHMEAEFKLDPNSQESKEHLREDLGKVIDKKIEDMDANELQFHYFRQHDYDDNEKLDGNELLMSITHHEIENPTDKRRVFSNEQLASVVDGILQQHDKNDDGYMDFTEYVAPMRAAKERAEHNTN